MTIAAASHFEKLLELIHCPICGDAVSTDGRTLWCGYARHRFVVEDEIPRLFVPNDWDRRKQDVTVDVKEFYERTPFPDYDEFDSVSSLLEKGRRGRFVRLLDEQLPVRTRVLEVGCGTGQLSNFLGIADREVIGTDMCLNSLRLADTFRRRHGLHRVAFFQMNLFRPIFKPGTFDLVVSNGVLHHTSDPITAFRTIAALVKPGGYIIVGLYNKYGRLMTDLRRLAFRAAGRRLIFLDSYLRRRADDRKARAWFADQYQHPHESKHTMGEVLRWFDEVGFAFVNSIPGSTFMARFSDDEKLFATHERAAPFARGAVQAHMIVTGAREGGLFIMIGARR